MAYSFVTEPSSIGLNVALKSTCEKSESKAAGSESLQDHLGLKQICMVQLVLTR